MRMTTKKKKSSSHINGIPGDLIVEILLRLPPISVVRFQGVCKQWYSLISNPDFQQTHASSFQSHQQQQQQHEIINNDQFLVFLFHQYSARVEFVPLTPFKEEKQVYRKLFHGLSPLPPGELVDLGLYPPRPDLQQFPMLRCSLIDSCNGLFLYHILPCNKNGTCDYDKRSFYICNPITKKYFKLPNIMDKRKREIIPCFKTVKLVFDTSISHSYKVLMVSWSGWAAYAHTEYWQMYSSETGTWRLFSTRNLDPNITDCYYNDCSRSVLLNGVLYWSHRSTTRADTSLCFDVEKESLGLLTLPPKPKYQYRNCNYFGKCDGRLQLIETLENPGLGRHNCSKQLPFSFDVMETETEPKKQHDGSVCCTWMVKYRVNDIRRFDDFFSKHSHLLIFHCYKMKNRQGENEEVLLVSTVDIYGSLFVYFSLTTNKFIKELAEDFEKERRFILGDVFAYTPTLFPVS